MRSNDDMVLTHSREPSGACQGPRAGFQAQGERAFDRVPRTTKSAPCMRNVQCGMGEGGWTGEWGRNMSDECE